MWFYGRREGLFIINGGSVYGVVIWCLGINEDRAIESGMVGKKKEYI